MFVFLGSTICGIVSSLSLASPPGKYVLYLGSAGTGSE